MPSNSISALLCRFLGHKRLRNKVWHDGIDYRAPCVRCGIPLIRDMSGQWRAFDWEKDSPPGSQKRHPRPHHEA